MIEGRVLKLELEWGGGAFSQVGKLGLVLVSGEEVGVCAVPH